MNAQFNSTTTEKRLSDEACRNDQQPLRQTSPEAPYVAHSGFRRFSAACHRKLQELKERLTERLAAEYAGLLSRRELRLVVNEADSLAATTPFPALFLPALAEEKVQVATAWHARQRLVLQGRSLALAA